MKKPPINFDALVRRYDRAQVGRSIELLPKQIQYVAKTFPRRLRFPKKRWSSVVFCGMGGSAIGADLLRYCYEPYVRARLTLVQGYSLPAFVDRNTLVVLCSYSGTTEEIISCFKDAHARKASRFVIARGGPLVRLAVTQQVPYYQFSEEYNPSKQPRIGTGYTMAALYMLLKRLDLLASNAPDLILSSRSMRSQRHKAAALARQSNGQSLMIIAAEHLRGNAHVMSNQMNESAKVFAPYFFLSELNHHLLEGLGSLKKARRHWTAVFLDSADYSPRMRKRVALTKHVFEKQGFKTLRIAFSGSRLSQCLAMLSLGGLWSYYSALLVKLDPSAIPWVDYFKKRL